jgi:nucleoside-diphosphate-sugar epimerase
MKIAVTGGSGELGRTLVPYLVEQGHAVVSIDRMLPADNETNPMLTRYVADTRNFGEFVGSLRGCAALIHLAAIRTPLNHPDAVVYNENTVSSYNALSAAATVGIKRICLASSVNALGGVYSRSPRYDYFPLDEQHPTYAEDPYSLSKWVLEQQADAFARRYDDMSIASMRFHWLIDTYEHAVEWTPLMGDDGIRDLWAYTLLTEASRACLLSLTANFVGHEAFYIVARRTVMREPSLELAAKYYPNTELRGDLSGTKGFYNTGKAEKILGWRHVD